MMTMSKALSAGQAKTYHAQQFSNPGENYYTEGQAIVGEWDGRLAEAWGLAGPVDATQFARLADGQDPWTSEQLVKTQTPHLHTDRSGRTVTTAEHRAGWDLTISAPKSVSLTALVGGDTRVRAAHREAVDVALRATEPYVQARIGGDHPAETTGQWVAAKFEHDSARPVGGYAAPQLHTHVVVFNMTRTEGNQTRALQPRELYRTQQYATAVYRSALAMRLTELGYEIERGRSGQPEIRGFTPEYLEASSPRRQQIEAQLEHEGQRGAAAAQFAAIQTREGKTHASPEETRRRHAELAQAHDDQPARAVAAARARQDSIAAGAAPRAHAATHGASPREAVAYARDRNLERDAVPHERDYLRDALARSMGEATVADVHAEFERHVHAGALVEVAQRPGAPGRAYTSPEMRALEQRTIGLMREGRDAQPPLIRETTRVAIAREYEHLAPDQREATQQLFANRDRVQALEGVAGAGKTTTLAAVRDAAERDGYTVQGLAPTGRAAAELAKAGMPTSTLQRHLRQPDDPAGGRRLYVLDESSLASTKQMHAFLQRMHAEDRVLLVGDARQHQAVDAGKPYEQLQDAGMAVARLREIKRQRDPELRAVVDRLARGRVAQAVAQMEAQGRVHEIVDGGERMRAVAAAYRAAPTGTLVVAPDNLSREGLNAVIRQDLQAAGHVARTNHTARVLVPRQDMTGADRRWAGKYAAGDVIRYTRGSAAHGLDAGAYARVTRIDESQNLVSVTDAHNRSVTYDPRRLQGVMVYREAERAFAKGDRVQFTAPSPHLRVKNRELATITKINRTLDVEVKTDRGRTVAFTLDQRSASPQSNPHLDHGYAVTSHSSQGQTADRVLVYLDSQRAGEKLVNERLAYVALSRGRDDAQIFTDDRAALPRVLSRDISKASALERPAAVRHEREAPRVAAPAQRLDPQPTSPSVSPRPVAGVAAAVGEAKGPASTPGHGATPDARFTAAELQRAGAYLARPDVQAQVDHYASASRAPGAPAPPAIEPRHMAATIRALPPTANRLHPAAGGHIDQSPQLMVRTAASRAHAEQQPSPRGPSSGQAPRAPERGNAHAQRPSTGHAQS